MPPREQVLHDLPGELAALDEEAEHFSPEERLDLTAVEVEEGTKAAAREPTAVGASEDELL